MSLRIAAVFSAGTGNTFLAAFYEIEQGRGILCEILLEGSRGDIEGIEIIDAVVAVEGNTAGGGFDICLAHGDDGVSAVVGDDFGDTEEFLVVMGVSVIDDPEELIDREHEVGRHLFDEGDAVCFLSKAEQETDRVIDYTSVEVDDLRRGHFEGIVSVIVGDILDSDSFSLRFGRSAEEVIAGDVVVISDLNEEVKSAFSDAFFVMGEKSLRDTEVSCSLFLADMSFFAL